MCGITVTDAGIQAIELYIARFRDPDGAVARINVAMLDRLKAGNRTDVDLRYYEHELMESEILPLHLSACAPEHPELNGAEPGGEELWAVERAAHHETLNRQGLGYYPGCGADLYHTDVILKHHDCFSTHTVQRALPLPLEED